MSAATDYLMHWIEAAEYRAPSMTRVTTRRPLGIRLPHDWRPGIASYGLAVNGRVLKDSAGNATGIQFSTVYSWPGDRGQAVAAPHLLGRSREAQFDTEGHTLQICGDAVVLTVYSAQRGSGFTSATKNLDADGRQLIFFVSGADPDVDEWRLALALGGSECSPHSYALGQHTADACWPAGDRLGV